MFKKSVSQFHNPVLVWHQADCSLASSPYKVHAVPLLLWPSRKRKPLNSIDCQASMCHIVTLSQSQLQEFISPRVCSSSAHVQIMWSVRGSSSRTQLWLCQENNVGNVCLVMWKCKPATWKRCDFINSWIQAFQKVTSACESPQR